MVLSKSILLVDDELPLRYTLSLILQRAGYRVKTALGGLEALANLRVETFDLVILDIAMPDLDGLSVLTKIHHAYSNTPVIMMTAHPSPETMNEAEMNGAREYLVKPIGPEQILAAVERAIAESPRLGQDFREQT